MNFLVLINNAPEYKYFFAEIAKEIECRGHKVYFAINAKRSTVLEPLKYVDSSEDTYFLDQYLSENEAKLSIKKSKLNETWGDIFYSDFDRFFHHNYNLNHDNKYWFSILNGLEAFFKEIISNKEIDIILYENVSNSFAYMAYKMGKELGCTYIGLMGSRLPNRYEIQTSIYSESKKIEENISKYELTDKEKYWYEDYTNNFFKTQPDYMKNNALNKKVVVSDLISSRKITTVKNYLKVFFAIDSHYDYQSGNPLRQLTSMYKLNWIKRRNEKDSYKYYLSIKEVDELLEDNTEIFYVYPTHYHPESSTSVLAPDFTHEITNIVNIHNNLPVGSYLYVKDHISARGTQNEDFYKKISALPGVRLIHFDYNVKKLIKSSQGVITITSTVGFEATLMNKNVYLFGRVFYEDFPNVHKLESFSQLRSIENMGTNPLSGEEFKSFLIAYYNYTFEGQLLIGRSELWTPSYFSKIVDDILYRIRQARRK